MKRLSAFSSVRPGRPHRLQWCVAALVALAALGTAIPIDTAQAQFTCANTQNGTAGSATAAYPGDVACGDISKASGATRSPPEPPAFGYNAYALGAGMTSVACTQDLPVHHWRDQHRR